MNMLVRQTEIGIEMNIYDTDFLGEKDYRAWWSTGMRYMVARKRTLQIITLRFGGAYAN
jgi:hypothetical protein